MLRHKRTPDVEQRLQPVVLPRDIPARQRPVARGAVNWRAWDAPPVPNSLAAQPHLPPPFVSVRDVVRVVGLVAGLVVGIAPVGDAC